MNLKNIIKYKLPEPNISPYQYYDATYIIDNKYIKVYIHENFTSFIYEDSYTDDDIIYTYYNLPLSLWTIWKSVIGKPLNVYVI
jgi:hypothetical protein